MFATEQTSPVNLEVDSLSPLQKALKLRSFGSLPSVSPEEDHNYMDIKTSEQWTMACFPNLPKVSEDEEKLLLCQYKMPLFAMTLFNVHYMNWAKNAQHMNDYVQRYSCLHDRVALMPEFDDAAPLPHLTEQQLRQWLIHKSISQCLEYRRQLVLKFHRITGLKSKKKFRIALVQDEAKQEEEHLRGCSVNEGDEFDFKFEETASPLVTDDEGDALSQEGVPSRPLEFGDVANDKMVNEDGHKQVHDEASLPSMSGEQQHGGLNMILGHVDLVEGLQHEITFPRETNLTNSDIFIKLSLIDSDDQTDREYVRIKISEAIISGYTGLNRKFNVKLNEELGQEALTESFEFELSAKWQIDEKCFQELVTDPVEVVNKLSGALFLFEHYYWCFYQGFYKWAVLHCEDQFVRYTAIQIFHELCLMLSPELLYDMTNIYRSMYPLDGYPQHEVLPISLCDYLPEPLSQLDNAMSIFAYLFKEEQIEVVRRLVPHSTILLFTRYRSIKRLVMLLRSCLSNYLVQDLHDVVLPFATDLLNHLSQVSSPEYELEDPHPAPVTWSMVNALAKKLCYLLVECIQCARPQNWAVIPIGHPEMIGTSALLNQCIESLFIPTGITFLKAIYIRLRNRKVLKDSQLAPFLTLDRIKQYREWHS